MTQHPIAAIEMENGKRIVIELYPEAAPNTVNSFIWLANQGCYDHHAIERIVPGWVADMSYAAFHQEICKYLIPNESRCMGFPNQLPMGPGTIGMGGYAMDEISGGEFFFPFVYSEKLDGRYPGFGLVVEGLEEIQRWERLELEAVELPESMKFKVNRPLVPLVIRSVRVETFGVDYPEPVRLEGHPLPPGWSGIV